MFSMLGYLKTSIILYSDVCVCLLTMRVIECV